MKRWGILFAVTIIVGLLLRLPQPGTDAAQLEPVEVVMISQRQGMVMVETDTGAKGSGVTLDQAVEDMKAHALGRIFLDTADFLLLDARDMDYAELYPLFRPGCSVCLSQHVTDIERAAGFLKNHRPENSLLQICAEERRIETLVEQKGVLELVR